ncbi:MAG TPA: hypothetical protein VF192_01200 [Longimicrobiales bacterium]
MSRVILEHVHDTDQGVYRLTVGVEVFAEQPIVENDELVYAEYEDVEGEDGRTVRVGIGDPLTELARIGYEGVESFVFAAHDERWADKDPETVAAEQRDIVRAALDEREEAAAAEAERRAAAQRELPGSGESL